MGNVPNERPRPGRVIFLNGASSSGKTTLAKALQQELSEPYLHVSLDGFMRQLPEWVLRDQQALARQFPALLAGFHAATAAIALAGNNIILDHVLQEPGWTGSCAEALSGVPVVFVAVTCPLEELERRESDRGDRNRGLARYQHGRVHSHGTYDLEVDTSVMSVRECVETIRQYVESGCPARAFDRLRQDHYRFKHSEQ